MNLRDKVVLITGAARRVGRTIAEALAQRGARIAVHYRSSKKEAQDFVGELQKGLGVDAMAIGADLNDVGAIDKAVAAVLKRFGAIHVLINSASIYEETTFGRTSLEDWDSHLNTNLRAPFFLSQAVAPAMRRAGGGKIINIADWSALRPYTGYMPYCISKAGLLCLNTVLAKELGPKIQVNAVMPGPVLLPKNFTAKQAKAIAKATLVKRLGSPEDIAKAAAFLIEQDFITGAALPVDGGRLIA